MKKKFIVAIILLIVVVISFFQGENTNSQEQWMMKWLIWLLMQS